jgi:choline kinase
MKAIILAAGRGSRMETLTDNAPKCLLLINGVSLLERQINAMKNVGINDISVVTGYKSEALKPYGLKEIFNKEWEVTNMVTSLSLADDLLSSDDCIISYSDIFYDSSALSLLIDAKSNISITYDPNWRQLWETRFNNPLIDAETFKLDADGKLIEIGGIASDYSEIDGQYMRLLKFSPSGWLTVKNIMSNNKNGFKSNISMTQLLQLIINSGLENIEVIKYEGSWGEIDSVKDYHIYNS